MSTVDVAVVAAAASAPVKKPTEDIEILSAIKSAAGTKTRSEIANELGMSMANFSQRYGKIKKNFAKAIEKATAEGKPLPKGLDNLDWFRAFKDGRGGKSGRKPGAKSLNALAELFKDSENVEVVDESLAE